MKIQKIASHSDFEPQVCWPLKINPTLWFHSYLSSHWQPWKNCWQTVNISDHGLPVSHRLFRYLVIHSPVSSPSLKGPLVWEVQDVSCDSGSGTSIEKLSCLEPWGNSSCMSKWHWMSQGVLAHKMPVLLWGPKLRQALQSILLN